MLFLVFSSLYFQIYIDTVCNSRGRKVKTAVFSPWCSPSTYPEGKWAISCYQLLQWRPFSPQQILSKEKKYFKHQLRVASLKGNPFKEFSVRIVTWKPPEEVSYSTLVTTHKRVRRHRPTTGATTQNPVFSSRNNFSRIICRKRMRSPTRYRQSRPSAEPGF